MKFKKYFKLAMALFYMLFGGLVLLITRKNYKPIYRGFKYFLEHESYQISLRILRNDPQFKELIETKYHANHPVQWDVLSALPSGTLGHEFAKFMNNPDVTPLEDLPEAKQELTPELDYMRARIRLVHDIHHVACGFPATEVGEMGISAFYVAQVNSSMNAILLAVSLVKCVMFSPARLHELMTTISEGWQLGLKSKAIFGIKWEEMWDWPVSRVRQEIGLLPSELDFVYPTNVHALPKYEQNIAKAE